MNKVRFSSLQANNNRTSNGCQKKSIDSIEKDLIAVFLGNPAHSSLLNTVIHDPSEENKCLVVSTFQKFIFQIRFTKYLSSLIRFADIDYHGKRKRVEERNPIIFDSPIGDEGELTLGEQLLQRNQMNTKNPICKPDLFLASIEDAALYNAFSKLTDRQKTVITLAYSACDLDTEIACALQVSQQAISKTRLLALKKMRNSIEHSTTTP